MYYEALLSPSKAAREVQMKLDNHGNHQDNCSDNLFEYYPMNTSTILTSTLNYGDTFANIGNVAGFITPQPLIGNFGYMFVNGEKIAYSYIDRTNNIVSGLRRGIGGTSSANVISANSVVISSPKFSGDPGFIQFGFNGNI